MVIGQQRINGQTTAINTESQIEYIMLELNQINSAIEELRTLVYSNINNAIAGGRQNVGANS